MHKHPKDKKYLKQVEKSFGSSNPFDSTTNSTQRSISKDTTFLRKNSSRSIIYCDKLPSRSPPEQLHIEPIKEKCTDDDDSFILELADILGKTERRKTTETKNTTSRRKLTSISSRKRISIKDSRGFKRK